MDSSTKYNAIVFLLTCLLNTWILFIAQLGLNFNILKNPYAYGERRALLLASTNWLWRYFHKTGWPKTRKAAQHKIVSLLKTPRLSVCDFSGRQCVIHLWWILWVLMINSADSNVSQSQMVGCHLGRVTFAWTCQSSAFSYLYASLWNLLPDVFSFFFFLLFSFPFGTRAHTFAQAGLELVAILLSASQVLELLAS